MEEVDYWEYCVQGDSSLRSALKILEEYNHRTVFVVDEKRLVGSLTDGDVRRYLLRGGHIDDHVLNASNKNPKTALNRYEAQKVYENSDEYRAIPIIDENGCILDVFTDKVKSKFKAKLGLPVVINAGGKGTRLEPYTKILPKPLIPVGDTPIVERIMQQFDNYGCSSFHIIVNYKKDIIKSYFLNHDSKQYDIKWYDEKEPLGTGGGLCYLQNKIHTTFFFTNCDNILLSNYDCIVRFHKQNRNVITMICALKNVSIPYGVIEMGLGGQICSMKEKPSFTVLVNTGVYIVEPEVLKDIEFERSAGFPDIIELEKSKGKRVSAYPISEKDWLDMGQFDELEKMRKYFESL